MIRNLIFDMGNVLIRYDPDHFIRREGVTDAGDHEALMKAIFASPDWALADQGELTDGEMEERVKERLPRRLHEAAHRLIFSWNDPVEPIEGMADFIAGHKAAGYKIFLLSNAGYRQPEYWRDIPGSEYFDGEVVSAYYRCVKPGPEIFRALMEKYGLAAEECLFIDDMRVNVEGARRVGMKGVVFDGDVEALRREVEILLKA